MDDLIKAAIALLMVTGFPLLFYAGYVAVRVFQRRLEGRSGGLEMVHELEELRARVAELEQVQGRVEELEERMDFSERMLTQDKQPGQLKP
jgi:Tfp pilus assembly protein PilO